MAQRQFQKPDVLSLLSTPRPSDWVCLLSCHDLAVCLKPPTPVVRAASYSPCLEPGSSQHPWTTGLHLLTQLFRVYLNLLDRLSNPASAPYSLIVWP